MTHFTTRRSLVWVANILWIVIALLVGAVTPAYARPVDAPHAQDAPVRFEPAPCDFDMQTGLVEGKDLQCGWLTVPEEYDVPDSGEIRLAVAIIKSHADNPASDPLFMLQGGPGGSTIYTYLQLIPLNPRLRQLDRDIVLFDQRGTRFSEPSLFCQETYDLGIELLDDDISREESSRRYFEALDACHDRLVREGVNLSAYDSLENARDVESLRLALGYDQINLYGVSYGSLLALHVLRDYPQGLRSVIIDSVVPTQTNFLIHAPQTVNDAVEKVFTSCAADADCNKAYPNLKEVFYEQVDRLNENKEPIQLFDYETSQRYPALLDGDTVIAMVTQMLYQTDLIPLIPRVIYQVRAGDYDFTEELLSLLVFDKSLNYGMYYSVLCAEDADYTVADVDLSGLPPQMEVAMASEPEEFLDTCANSWVVDALPASVDDPVSSDLPVLVLSGGFDPVTPPAYGAQAAESLPNSYSFVFPYGGHGAVSSGECQENIFLQFLAEPSQKPDGACIAEQKLEFSTPGALVSIPTMLDMISLRESVMLPLALLMLALLFLLSALLVYPVVWVVRLMRGSSSTPAAVPAAPSMEGAAPAPAAPAAPVRRPLFYRLAPWISALTGIVLLVFVIVLVATAISMALANDSRIYFGLPGSARPLFLLPLLAALLALVMLVSAAAAWLRRAGSVWGRLYLTLLSFAAIACVAMLGVLRLLTAFFRG